MRCTLDFVHVVLEDASDPNRFSFQPDGSLVTEFVLMEQIYEKTRRSSSNDPFWCHLDESGATTILSHLPHDIRLECLDIAAPSTLGRMRNASEYENYTLNTFQFEGYLNATGNLNLTQQLLFGGDTFCNDKVVGDGTINTLDMAVLMYAQFAADPYFDAWVPKPEAGFWDDEATGGPATTEGRENPGRQCGNGILPNQYQLELSTDFCLAHEQGSLEFELPSNAVETDRIIDRRLQEGHEQDVADSITSSARTIAALAGAALVLAATAILIRQQQPAKRAGLSAVTRRRQDAAAAFLSLIAAGAIALAVAIALATPVARPANVGRRLEETGLLPERLQPQQHHRGLQDPSDILAVETTDRLVALAAQVVGTSSEQMRSLDASVATWATIPGLGEWSRIHLPGVVIAAELFLVNFGGADSAGGIDYERPPAAGCADEACAPSADERGRTVVRFRRRSDEFGSRDPDSCAYIGSDTNAVVSGVASVRQTPPQLACPFDLFLWVPASAEPAFDRRQLNSALVINPWQCGGLLGVMPGSTAMDGFHGAIQLASACQAPLASPAPPSPAVPPAPPPPPPPSLLSVAIDELGLVGGLDEIELLAALDAFGITVDGGGGGGGAFARACNTTSPPSAPPQQLPPPALPQPWLPPPSPPQLPQQAACRAAQPFTLDNAHLVHSNLGGAGPDLDAAASLRFGGVGLTAGGEAYDLEVTHSHRSRANRANLPTTGCPMGPMGALARSTSRAPTWVSRSARAAASTSSFASSTRPPMHASPSRSSRSRCLTLTSSRLVAAAAARTRVASASASAALKTTPSAPRPSSSPMTPMPTMAVPEPAAAVVRASSGSARRSMAVARTTRRARLRSRSSSGTVRSPSRFETRPAST